MSAIMRVTLAAIGLSAGVAKFARDLPPGFVQQLSGLG
jgi:hypothetical protein